MEIRDYLRVAGRQWWVMVIAVLVALGVTQVINERMPPEYAATVTFFMTTPGQEGGPAAEGAMFMATRMKTYSELLTSDRMATEIAEYAGLDLTTTQIKDRIKVDWAADSVIIVVTVVDGYPARLKRIAETLAPRFAEMVRVLESRAVNGPAAVARLVEPPRFDPTPISPRPLHNDALAVAVGLLLGAALAVVREVTDNAVREASVLPELTGAPVLARIPVDRKGHRVRKRRGPFISDSRSPRAEALRHLRTTVSYADREHPVKILAVTSAMPNEGRSATACGLAILFAEAGQRVLIVDAELRRPRLAAFLGREGSAGLTTVLLGGASLDQVLQPWGAGLWLLASGHRPPNPSELLGSDRMADLIDELRSRFDKIIFDSPPLLPVTDGAVVAARADGALLIVRSRRTTTAQVAAAVRALAAVDARLLGTVFNMVAAPRRRLGLPRLGPRAAADPPPPPAPRPGGWQRVALSGAT